jgi:hypothetical protein
MGAVLGFEYEPFYSDLVRRAFYGDAPGGPVPAGIILANDRIEWAVVRKEIPFSVANFATAGGAGTFNIIQITAGGTTMPDVIAVVERLWVVSANLFGVQLVTPPLATTASSRAVTRDIRSQAMVTFAGINSTLLAAQPFSAQYPATPAQGEEIPIRPFVVGSLPTGAQSALVIASNIAQTNLTVVAYGYQRRLRPEELRLEQ